MTFTLIMAWVIGVLLFVAAALTLVRVVQGPSVLDRVIASDVMLAIVVCSLAAHAAFDEDSTTLPILISVSLIGFMGAVAVARFVARDRDMPVEDDPELRPEISDEDWEA